LLGERLPTREKTVERKIKDAYVSAAKSSPAIYDALNDIWTRYRDENFTDFRDKVTDLNNSFIRRFPARYTKIFAQNPSETDIRLGTIAAAKVIGATTRVERPETEMPIRPRKENQTKKDKQQAVPLEHWAEPGANVRAAIQDHSSIFTQPLRADELATLRRLARVWQDAIVTRNTAEETRRKARDDVKDIADKRGLWRATGEKNMPSFSAEFTISNEDGTGTYKFSQHMDYNQLLRADILEGLRKLKIPEPLYISDFKLDPLLKMIVSGNRDALRMLESWIIDDVIEPVVVTSVDEIKEKKEEKKAGA
jgi:hypothetical protein